MSKPSMDGLNNQESARAQVRARRAAMSLLGVAESASPSQLKTAWRKRCLETHPDRNMDDPNAKRRFQLVNCAYRLLADGMPCDELLAHDVKAGRLAYCPEYDLSNTWGFYLWWRERFF